MTPSPLPELTLYTRAGCHLCEDTRAVVQALLEERAAGGRRTAALREQDISRDPEWERRFTATVPVLELDGHVLELATSAARIRRFLDESLEGSLA